MLLSALDNSRYTSIRQCRTIAEREAARNRAVSLTTCNGTAVSIGRFLCVVGETVHTPHRPSFSRVFHKTKRQRIGRAASRENRKVEGVKGRERVGVVWCMRDVESEGKPSRTDDTKSSRTTERTLRYECASRDRRTNARTSDGCNFAIRASARIVHAPLKTTKQCVQARFCPVTSRPFPSRPQPEKERAATHTTWLRAIPRRFV